MIIIKSKNIYSFPLDEKWTRFSFQRKILYYLEQLMTGCHKGYLKNSIDWIVPTGTPIYAADAGKVVWVRDDSNKGGPFKRYWLKGNRIVIRHRNGEYSAYEHLRHGGVLVKEGDRVRRKQLMGYSGRTGYGLLPHLHFEVFINPDEEESEGTTIEPRFQK